MTPSLKINIEKLLLEEHSKKQVIYVCSLIQSKPSLEGQLLDAFFIGDKKLGQRSAWVLFHYFKNCPERFLPYLDKAIPLLEHPLHIAQARNILNILQLIEIPEEHQGIIYDICFNYLSNPCNPIAVRVFSLQVASDIALRFPSLAEEIIGIMEVQESLSPGMISRWRKIGRKLKKVVSENHNLNV